MAKGKVIHERKDCIACGACAAIAPEYWFMDDDSFSTLKGATAAGDNFELEVSSDEALEANEEAAEVCPVQIIHVKKE